MAVQYPELDDAGRLSRDGWSRRLPKGSQMFVTGDVQTVWQVLQAVTMVLQFAAALVGLVGAVWTLVRRIRRWRRQRH